MEIISKKEALALGIIDDKGLGFVKPQTAFRNINEQILAEVKKGNLIWRKPWRSGVVVKGRTYGAQNYETQRPYRGGNAFYIAVQNWINKTNYNFFLTKKQIDERGYKLKKDAKAFVVSVYIETEKVRESKGKEIVTLEKGVIWYRVYPIEHLDNFTPIKRRAKNEDTNANEFVSVDAEALVAGMPKAPEIKHGGDSAYYSPIGDYVQMPVKKAFKQQQFYYSVLFHELVHSTGAKKRLNRDMSGVMKGNAKERKSYALEELIAEIGAAYLCGVCNLDYYTLKNSAAYLKGWSSSLQMELKTDPFFLNRAVYKAARAANFIIGKTLDKVGEVTTEEKSSGKEDKTTKDIVQAVKDTIPGAKVVVINPKSKGKLPAATMLKIHWHEGSGKFDKTVSKTWKEFQEKFLELYRQYKKSGGGGYDKVKIEITWANGKRIVDRADVGDGKADFNPTQETIGQYLKRQKSVMYDSNFNQGERELVSWNDADAAPIEYTGKTITPNKAIKANLDAAIEDLMNVYPKYKKLGAMAIQMLYSAQKNNSFPDCGEDGLKAKNFEKLENADLVEENFDSGKYEITEAGKELFDKITARLETLKAKKRGTDLFPDLSGPQEPGTEFLVQYMELHGKTIHAMDLAPIIVPLQQAIKAGKINNTHPLRHLINACQDKLVKLYNSAGGGAFKVHVSNRVAVGYALQKHGLGFLPVVIAAVAAKATERIMDRKILPVKSTGEKGKSIVANLRGTQKKKDNPKQEKKGLGSLETETSQPAKISQSTLADGGFVTASESAKVVKAPDVFRLPGEVGKFLQDMQRYKYAIVLTGDPHAGKTEFVMQVADAFAGIKDEVGMFMLEQGGLESKDTKAAVERNISPVNQKHVHITGSADKGIETIKKFARSFKVVIIDSWQKLGLPGTAFDQLRHEFPETIWIVIFQQNGEGGTRGGVAADYDTPVLLKVHKVDNTRKFNWVELKKNRGNSLNLKYMMATKKTVPFELTVNEKNNKPKKETSNDNAKN